MFIARMVAIFGFKFDLDISDKDRSPSVRLFDCWTNKDAWVTFCKRTYRKLMCVVSLPGFVTVFSWGIR